MKRQYKILSQSELPAFVSLVAKFRVEQPLLITVEHYKASRSLAQNSLFWAWMTEIAEHVSANSDNDFSKQDMHDWFVDEYLPKRVIDFQGKMKIHQVGTKELKVQEFSDFLDKIDYYCADKLGLNLSHDGAYQEAMGNG